MFIKQWPNLRISVAISWKSTELREIHINPRILHYEITEPEFLWCSRHTNSKFIKFLLPFFQFCIEIVTTLIADITKSAESDEDSESNDKIEDDGTLEEPNDSQAEAISKDEL